MTSEEDKGIGIRSWLAGQKSKSRTPESIPQEVVLDKHRIAVLPFSSISPDVKDEYFADGLTEELISTISSLQGLRVISRTSAMNYKNTTKKLFEIGKELNVGVAVEGSVRKAGNNVRITVQLIDAKTDEHLWSDSYDRQLTDIFAIQTDIAKQVAKALSVRIAGPETARISKIRTESTSAYQNYLMGNHLKIAGTEDNIRRAIQFLERAVKEDPSFAEAYVSLAQAHENLGHYSFASFDESCKTSKAMAEKALQIDHDLSEAHAVLGALLLNYDWNFIEAEKELGKAIALNPSSSLAHRVYARCLATLGRLNEAVSEVELALKLDPLNILNYANKGVMYMLIGREEEGWESWRKARELFPDLDYGAWHPVLYLLNNERFNEARLELDKLKPAVLAEPLFKLLLGYLYARTGRTHDAKRILGELRELCKKGYSSEDHVAYVYAGLGDKEEFFRWMKIAVENHHAEPYAIKNHRSYCYPSEIGRDTRWNELLEIVGMS